jgi:putative NADH-flavin reductase
MNLTILGATGATGRELVRRAIDRGHTVTAIARHPDRLDIPDSGQLIRVAADVLDSEAIAASLAGSDIVLSGLGNVSGQDPQVLSAGARAVVAAAPQRIIWLGAFGTGSSAPAAGPLTRALLGLVLRGELGDKVAADGAVLAAGGTLFHAGPLTNGALSETRRTLELDAAPRRIFPARISRATVAAAMIDEAEGPAHHGTTLVPLDR